MEAALLRDYNLIFSGFSSRWNSSVANMIPADQHTVWGGVYTVTDENIITLDELEGTQGYKRKVVSVEGLSRITYKAFIYFSDTQDAGQPSNAYLSVMKAGITDCNLDEYSTHIIPP